MHLRSFIGYIGISDSYLKVRLQTKSLHTLISVNELIKFDYFSEQGVRRRGYSVEFLVLN